MQLKKPSWPNHKKYTLLLSVNFIFLLRARSTFQKPQVFVPMMDASIAAAKSDGTETLKFIPTSQHSLCSFLFPLKSSAVTTNTAPALHHGQLTRVIIGRELCCAHNESNHLLSHCSSAIHKSMSGAREERTEQMCTL